MRRAIFLGFTGLVAACAGTATAPAPRAASEHNVESSPTAPPPAVTAVLQRESADAATVAALKQARASFETFLERSQGNPEYAEAVTRAHERIEDIDRTLIFVLGSRQGAAR